MYTADFSVFDGDFIGNATGMTSSGFGIGSLQGTTGGWGAGMHVGNSAAYSTDGHAFARISGVRAAFNGYTRGYGIYIGGYGAYSGGISKSAVFAMYNTLAVVHPDAGIHIEDDAARSDEGPAAAIFQGVTVEFNGLTNYGSDGLYIGGYGAYSGDGLAYFHMSDINASYNGNANRASASWADSAMACTAAACISRNPLRLR